MVSNDKYDYALKAIHAVTLQARLMAYRNDPHKEIASILDYADHLFNLLQEKNDNTVKFRACLVDIIHRFNCAFVSDVLKKFDN